MSDPLGGLPQAPPPSEGYRRAPQRGARIVTWVIAALGVLGAVSSLAQAGTTASKTLSLIGGLIDLVIIVLLAMAPSNQYFKPRY